MNLKTRFAPTPSGFLHAGNVFSLLLTWLIARKNQGKILLRIDDLDQGRIRKPYVENIFRILDWLELDYDEGPVSIDDFNANFSQLRRMDLYEEALNELEGAGRVFYCSCSRSEILRVSSSGNYPGTCLQSSPAQNKRLATRLITSKVGLVTFDDQIKGLQPIDVHEGMPYFVIRKKDRRPAYQLASLVDDHHFGVNCVVRGDDLLLSTVAQLYLAQSLNRYSFSTSRFYHHPLLMKGQQKLSKSQGDRLTDRPVQNDQLKRRLFRNFSAWLGLEDEIDNLKSLLQHFEMGHLQHLRGTGN